MDQLQEIVKLLPEEACEEFSLFINRQRHRQERKDLALFWLLRKENFQKPAQYISCLYTGRSGANAYHALRKRLFKHLTSFLVLQRLEADNTSASQVMGILSLCRYLYEQQKEHLAWHYLKKAEELASENEQFDLLHTIYSLQVEYADSEHSDSLQHIMQKRQQNKQLLELEENAALASSLIRQRLQEVRLSGKQLDIDAIISRTLQEFNLHNSVYQKPKFLYNILSITRSAMLAKKSFSAFEPFMLEQYRKLDEGQVFTKASHYYKLSILYMLCHVLYRNRKFKEALPYLWQFADGLQEHQGAYVRKFWAKYLMLLAAVESYLGRSHESIRLLEDGLVNCSFLKEEERLQMLLNAGLYYFQQGNLKKANQISLRIDHTDSWCIKKLGKEWVMKKNLMELLIQFELGNTELVLTRLKTFYKHYAPLFGNPLYRRVKVYATMLEQLAENPLLLHDKQFESKAIQALVVVPEDQEDLQAMTFYSWLKAKLLKRPYYETLLETVQRPEAV